jgi:hypothetical protein
VCGPDIAAVRTGLVAARWLQLKVAMLQTTLQQAAVSGVLRHLQLCGIGLRVSAAT